MKQEAISLPGALLPLGELVLPLATRKMRYVRPSSAHATAHAAFYRSDRARAQGWTEETGATDHSFRAMAAQRATRGFGPFVAELRETGEPVGIFGPWQPDGQPEPEIKWIVWDAAHEGRSLAFEGAVVTLSFAYWVYGWRTAVSYIAPGNDRSIRLAKRLGALRDGSWNDDAGRTLEIWRHPAPEDTE
ncbi:GNAT family N-acetyltransferase [Pelagovum pacificum]|uniref:GNAT family N-acetyltransferase n=1 Tax=Pelagovum pacificum TaxID=2588711 RepID=A0A5C5GH69_9RHOB|nr:GNAT family N-acetyltransferase [Pelagovum pacificum]QQA43436.1 GNAT family N-acetyltransferase [Pelagovum pacificum]TNY33427.1 GNAT family N-acetyltransferase [Pelagovum pacificum]